MPRAPNTPAGSPRFIIAAVLLAGALILAAGALLGFALHENPKGAAGTLLGSAIGGPFHLVDQNGKPVSDADLKGKWQLVFFGYTHCPDTCPTALNEISLALDQLGTKRDEVEVVFITVDPERDTPDVLKSYVQSFDASIIALTGSPEAVAQAAKDYRVYYAKHSRPDGGYDMDHSAVIYIMDPQGRFTATFTPDATADAMAERLQKLLS
ncbi:MAG TPA: SCO family protein [Stellaceae bacterium]|jgi:protein SCO1/2|nr:SCO family protein [Stellaceae bacterium]